MVENLGWTYVVEHENALKMTFLEHKKNNVTLHPYFLHLASPRNDARPHYALSPLFRHTILTYLGQCCSRVLI